MNNVTSAGAATQFLVIDDHAVVAAGMASMLAAAFPGAPVATVTTVHAALEFVQALPPGAVVVALLDLMMGASSGLEFLGAAPSVAEDICLRTIVLSGVRSQDQIDECQRRGAHGYVCKTEDPAVVLQAIGTVLAGATQFGAGERDADARALARLAPSLRRVYDLVVQDAKSNKQIANELGIGDATVKNYMHQLLRALNVRTRAELILQAHRVGKR